MPNKTALLNQPYAPLILIDDSIVSRGVGALLARTGDADGLSGTGFLFAVLPGFALDFGFFVLALAFFFALFFFLPAADFDLSARNSALSFFICFFNAFFSASTDLLAM
jgi:hypothetical protein